MATVLDFSILSNLSVIFIFIAVFIGGWGLLSMIDIFGFKDEGRKKIYAVLAFALAFLVILSRPVLGLVAFSIPWFSVILFVAFFMLFFAKMFDPGLDTASLIKDTRVYGFLIFFVGVVVLFALGGVFGQALLEQSTGVSDADRITGVTTPVDSFVPADEFVDQAPRSIEGSVTPPAASNSFAANIVLTLFHPKILGMLFMMLLGTITILLLAR